MSEDPSYFRSGHSGTSIEIDGQFILIDNGYINSTIDYILIREYVMENEQERLSDIRYQRNGFMASVKSPNGRTIPLRNTKKLFYLHDNQLESYLINLEERELFILHSEPHESIDDLIKNPHKTYQNTLRIHEQTAKL